MVLSVDGMHGGMEHGCLADTLIPFTQTVIFHATFMHDIPTIQWFSQVMVLSYED